MSRLIWWKASIGGLDLHACGGILMGNGLRWYSEKDQAAPCERDGLTVCSAPERVRSESATRDLKAVGAEIFFSHSNV